MNNNHHLDEKAQGFLVSNIRTSPDASLSDVYLEAKRRLQSIHVKPLDATYSIYKKSIDARHRDAIQLVWTVCVKGFFSIKDHEKLINSGFRQLKEPQPRVEYGQEQLKSRPVVVGSGPAGLFAAYLLALNGYCPHLIERGGSIAERVDKVAQFINKQTLDVNTNVQFGAGGAGTFSDGKLMTRISDEYIPFILQTFVKFGAPEDILTQAKPHIGTDVLRGVVQSMLDEIEKLGGIVSYHTQMLDIFKNSGSGGSILTNRGDMPFGALVLATGHSARDTYKMLIARQFDVKAKPFSVGVRVEHLQLHIDEAMFGRFAGHPALGHAEYALSHHTSNGGVYTFCMCPGGEVIAAASEYDTVVVNGMSHHARDGVNANSAVAVSVRPEQYGSTPQRAIRFQQSIEEAAFGSAGSSYAVPLVTMGDFMESKAEHEPYGVYPTYMNGQAFQLCLPDAYLPSFVCAGLREGFAAFSRQLRGFTTPEAIICGPETRTSAPVRVMRGEDRTAIGFDDIYPCGEGAGYAGGITSAAADGIATALAIMKRYAPN